MHMVNMICYHYALSWPTLKMSSVTEKMQGNHVWIILLQFALNILNLPSNNDFDNGKIMVPLI